MDGPTDNDAETARIRHDLEIEAKRHKWTLTPIAPPQQEEGIIGWLINKKVVEKESQANVALLGVAIIATVLAFGIFTWGTSTEPTIGPTQQQIDAMHQPIR